MQGLFNGMIETLEIAQDAMRSEVASLADAAFVDRRALEIVQVSVLRFGAEADDLIAMMEEQGASDSFREVARELADRFRSIERQIEVLLTGSRDVNPRRALP